MNASVPISLKVILVSLFCVAMGLAGTAFVALDFQKTESQTKVLEANKDLAETLGREVLVEIQSSLDKMTHMAQIFADSKSNETQSKLLNYMNYQEGLVSFGVYGSSQKDVYSEFLFLAKQTDLGEIEISQNNLDTKLLPSIIKSASQHRDSVSIINSSLLIRKPLITFAYTKDKKLYRSEFKTNNLLRYFIHREGLGIYLVDSGGSILLSNGQTPSDSILRASKDIGFGLNIIVDSEEPAILMPVARLQYRTLLVGVMALGLTFIFAYLFSGQFTSSILSLHKALERITAGHFEANPDVHSNDELGTLSLAFKKLTTRLQDRERLKSTLVKFTKQGEAEKILMGEIKLPQEKKSMTILICELHSGLNSSIGVEATIKHVNTLWSEVSRSVHKYLGFIDKSNGNFMRAVWGALAQFNDEGASALSAALDIRKAIKNINEKRSSAGLAPFKIGIGIHTGEVIAGQIGIEGRTEYTFVGDGPLYATKISAATRDVKTDILISEETYDLIKTKGFTFGPMQVVENFDGIKVHQVIGRKSQDGVIESELSKSEQELILTQSYEMQTQIQQKPSDGFREPPVRVQVRAPVQRAVHPQPSESTQVMMQGPPSISLVSEIPFEVRPAPTQSPGNYPQANPSTQTEYRFDNSSSTNSAIAFQTPSAMANHVAQPAQTSQVASAIMPVPQNAGFISPREEPQWYLMRNPQSGVTEGPFTVNDLRAISEQVGFVATQSYAFRYGDTMMVPLLQVPGVSRREARTQMPPSGVPLPSEQIQSTAGSEDWYVQREGGQVYGPYSFAQLSGFLESGHITRSSYCWRQGLANWLYAYQVPGLDRRQNGPPAPPIPLPKVG